MGDELMLSAQHMNEELMIFLRTELYTDTVPEKEITDESSSLQNTKKNAEKSEYSER